MIEKNTTLYVCDVCGKANIDKDIITDCENNCKEIKQLRGKVKPFHWYIMSWHGKDDNCIQIFAKSVKFIRSSTVNRHAKIEIYDYVHYGQYYEVHSGAYNIREILTPNEAYEKYNLIVPDTSCHVKLPWAVTTNLNEIVNRARKDQYDLLIKKDKEELVNMIIDSNTIYTNRF